VRIARRVGTTVSDTPRPAACGANSAASTREQRCQRNVVAVGDERTGFEPRQIEELLELRVERFRGRLHAADKITRPIVARLRGQRRHTEAQRMQRLPQVVARRGQQLALGAIGGLCGGACFLRHTRARAELADEVGVLVANRE